MSKEYTAISFSRSERPRRFERARSPVLRHYHSSWCMPEKLRRWKRNHKALYQLGRFCFFLFVICILFLFVWEETGILNGFEVEDEHFSPGILEETEKKKGFVDRVIDLSSLVRMATGSVKARTVPVVFLMLKGKRDDEYLAQKMHLPAIQVRMASFDPFLRTDQKKSQPSSVSKSNVQETCEIKDTAFGSELRRILSRHGIEKVILSQHMRCFRKVSEFIQTHTAVTRVVVLFQHALQLVDNHPQAELEPFELPEPLLLKNMLSAYREGHIHALGTLAPGDAAVLSLMADHQPVHQVRLPYARKPSLQGIPERALDGKFHIGVFGQRQLKENAIPQLIAACTLGSEVVIHVRALGFEMPYLKYCSAEIRQHPEAQLEQHWRRIVSAMDLNLAVSLADPLLDLAMMSMASGVPVLVGPAGSAIYAQTPALADILVCPVADASDHILLALTQAISAVQSASDGLQEAILFQFAGLNALAAQSLATFLDLPPYFLYGSHPHLALPWNTETLPPSLIFSSPSHHLASRSRSQPAATIHSGRKIPARMPKTWLLPEYPVSWLTTCRQADEEAEKSALVNSEGHQTMMDSMTTVKRNRISANRADTVLLVSYELAGVTPGGAGTVVDALSTALLESGRRIILLVDMAESEAWDYEQAQRKKGVGPEKLSVILLSSVSAPVEADMGVFCGKAKQWAIGVERVVRQQPVDIVEFFEYAGPASVLLARRLIKAPGYLPASVRVVVRVHGSLEFIMLAEQQPFDPQQEDMFLMERFSLSAADVVIVPSAPLGEFYAQHCHIRMRSVIVGVPPVRAALQGLSASSGNPEEIALICQKSRFGAAENPTEKSDASPGQSAMTLSPEVDMPRNRPRKPSGAGVKLGKFGSRSENELGRRLDGGLPQTSAGTRSSPVASQKYRRALRISRGKRMFSFLILGKLQRIKNPTLVARAAVEFLERLPPSFLVTFTFIGKVVRTNDLPDPYEEVLKEIPAQFRPYFKFQDALPREKFKTDLCNYHVAIVASSFETFNMVAHELTYLGIPLIISDFAAFRPYFDDTNAYIFRQGNVASLRDAMIQAMEQIDEPVPVRPLHYDDPVYPYDCILSNQVSATPEEDLQAWWRSQDALYARDLLHAMGCSSSMIHDKMRENLQVEILWESL